MRNPIERTSRSLPPEEALARAALTAPDAGDASVEPTHRVITLLAAVGLFAATFATWGTSILLPVTGLIAVAAFATILVVIVVALAATRSRTLYRVDFVLLITGVVLLCSWGASLRRVRPAYGTDEAAFTQAAANLILHGHSPYGVDLGYALSQYRVPTAFWTLLLNGHVVTSFGYPPAAAVFVALYAGLFGSTQAVMIVDLIALVVTTLMMFFMLPRRWRALAVLATVGLPVLEGFATSGNVSVVMVMFMVVCAYKWTEIGSHERLRRRDWLSAVCLGLAAACSPLSWFSIPFLLTGVYILRAADFGPRRAARVLARYGGAAAATFLVINLPFIVTGPGSWFSSVTAPLTQGAIPYGQGFVSLILFFHVGGGDLHVLALAAAAAYLGILAVFALNFRTLARACFVLAVIPLFFAARSLSEYFTVMIPVWIVSVTTISPESLRAVREHRWSGTAARRASYVLPLAPAAVLLIVALATPSPLTLTVQEIKSAARRTSLWQIKVLVHNNSGDSLSPHFVTNSSGLASNYWRQVAGPAALAPDATAQYTLDAPNIGSQASGNQPVRLIAMTDSPATFSSSGAVTAYHYALELEPKYVIRVLAPGESVHLTAALSTVTGNPIAKAGVTIGLAQTAYKESSATPPTAEINGHPEGESPVYATTNARGVAHFVVKDDNPPPNGGPVQFQAFIQHRVGAERSRYSFSEHVTVFWRR
ncbi:MAG TPA: hypothetical protein VMA83_09850 [Solirubrobacteraceae bacterium]|nr:hypothetical protein [Solirubrobacteraceae bacterium]